MVSSMKEKFEVLKKYKNISLNYDDILLYYPDYYKTKIELENEKFISKEYVDEEFEKEYKNSPLYNKLVKLAMAEDEIYEFMKHNKDYKYNCLNRMFDGLVKYSIDLCELIDYIGHYPTTYPVPKDDEKNPKMEDLLEKYDIIVRYHLGDIDEMQIVSDDVVRIVEKLTDNLELLNSIRKNCATNEWMFQRNMNDSKRDKLVNEFLESVTDFPLSHYQEQEKSHREEGKMFLRRQHGKNII